MICHKENAHFRFASVYSFIPRAAPWSEPLQSMTIKSGFSGLDCLPRFWDLEGLCFIIADYWSLSEPSPSASLLSNLSHQQTHTSHNRERVASVGSKGEVLKAAPRGHKCSNDFSQEKTHCSTCSNLACLCSQWYSVS